VITEKYCFRSLNAAPDLYIELGMDSKISCRQIERLALDWALTKGIPCAQLYLGWVDLTSYVCPQFGVFDGSAFCDAKFDESRFENCSFTGCRFDMCRFQEAQFVGCDFSTCVFVACKLNFASYRRCNFAGSTFDRCDYISTQFADCRFDGINYTQEETARFDFEKVFAAAYSDVSAAPIAIDQVRNAAEI
jgi:hypothetical protein